MRELDYFLDTQVVDNLWQVMVAIVSALVIVYCYRHWKRLRIAWFRVWPSPGLTLYFAGAVIVFASATFIGHESFWQAVQGEHYQRIVKLAVEELIEFTGYTLWLVGTVEYYLSGARHHAAGTADRGRQASCGTTSKIRRPVLKSPALVSAQLRVSWDSAHRRKLLRGRTLFGCR